MARGNRSLAMKKIKAVHQSRYGGTPKKTWAMDGFKGKKYDDLIDALSANRRVVRAAPAFEKTYTLIRNGVVVG